MNYLESIMFMELSSSKVIVKKEAPILFKYCHIYVFNCLANVLTIVYANCEWMKNEDPCTDPCQWRMRKMRKDG